MKKLLLSLLLLLPLTAQAISIKADFTASQYDFPSDISGSFVYEAASLSSPIDSLLSIDLTIEGDTYSLSDIGFTLRGSDLMIVGGILNGAGTISTFSAENDFLLAWA